MGEPSGRSCACSQSEDRGSGRSAEKSGDHESWRISLQSVLIIAQRSPVMIDPESSANDPIRFSCGVPRKADPWTKSHQRMIEDMTLLGHESVGDVVVEGCSGPQVKIGKRRIGKGVR